MIDLTLDSMLVPALEGYKPVVGKKIEYTALNKGGLSTQQVVENIAMPFIKQRSILVEESATTSVIEFDASIMVSGNNVTLTLDRGVSPGIEIQIMCLNPARIRYTGISKNSEGLQNTLTDELNAFALTNYIWTGTAWFCSSAPGIGAVKEQFPGTPEPYRIYGGQWAQLKLAGMFLRASGGDARPYTELMKVTVNDTSIVVDSDDSESVSSLTTLAVNDLLICDEEYRTVTAIDGNTITIDEPFSSPYITNVIIGQNAGLPNITGGRSSTNTGFYGTGAFKSIDGSVYAGTDTINNQGSFEFKASLGETKTNGTLKKTSDYHVYGKSDTVITQNITVRYWKRVS